MYILDILRLVMTQKKCIKRVFFSDTNLLVGQTFPVRFFFHNLMRKFGLTV